jgi:hypothetical protein
MDGFLLIAILCYYLFSLIQVDIGGHPPFIASSKQLSGNFGNLLFLAVFWVVMACHTQKKRRLGAQN